MKDSSLFKGIFYVAGAAFCWSIGGVLLKLVNAGVGAISAWRYLSGLIAIMILNRSLPVFRIKDKNGSVDKKSTILLWLGGIAFACASFLYACANKYTTAANAILLQYTNPIWIIIFGPLLLKEKNRYIDFLAIGGVLTGMVLFFASELKNPDALNQTKIFGNCCAIISGFFLAFYTMIMRMQKSGKSIESSMLSQLIGLIFTCPFLFISPIPDCKSLVFLILTGIINGALAIFLYPLGLKKIPALTASLISMIEPILNPIWVFLFAGEIPSFSCIAGGFLILGFVAFRIIYIEKTKTKNFAQVNNQSL